MLIVAARLGRADDLYHWSPVRIGAGGFVTGFVTHPRDATVRYCRTDVGNAYRWDAATGQWLPMVAHFQNGSAGMPASAAPAPGSSGVESLALDPRNPRVVYMAFRNGFSGDVANQYAAIKGCVYKSTDGGRTFVGSDLSIDMSANSAWRTMGERMAVDPRNPRIVYYGSNDNGLWRSRDGGRHWSQVTGGGVPDGSKVILGVHIGPADSTGTEAISAVTLDGGVFQSGDGGATWTDRAAGTGLEGHTGASILAPDGSLWVVQDGSNVVWHDAAPGWTSTTADFGTGQNVNTVAVDPANPQRLWAIGWGGALARSADRGLTWVPCGTELHFANTLGWLPQRIPGWRSNSGIFYDRTGRLWVSQGNEGMLTYQPTNTETASAPPHWTIQSEGIEEFVTHDVVMPPGGPAVVAVEDGTGFVVPHPTQFTATQIPLQDQLISNGTGVAYCPNAPSSLAVVTADVNHTHSGLTYSGYSLDGGATWQHFASDPADSQGNPVNRAGSIAISRRGGWGDGADHLVWVPTGGGPDYWSHDGGKTWHPGSGFPETSGYWIFALKQRALKADPFVPDKFFYIASRSGGCYVSTDGGALWSKTSGTALPAATHHGQLETNAAVPNDLWFVDGWEGASEHGVWHSTDGGTTFVHSGAFTHALTLAVGKGRGRPGDQPYSVYVYGLRANAPQWGIFRSDDAGATWVRVGYYPAGLFDQPTCMAASWDAFGHVIIGFGGNSFVQGAALTK